MPTCSISHLSARPLSSALQKALNYIVLTVWPALRSACLSFTPTEKKPQQTNPVYVSAQSNLIIRWWVWGENEPMPLLITTTYDRHTFNLPALRRSLSLLTQMLLDREYKKRITQYIWKQEILWKYFLGNGCGFPQNFFAFVCLCSSHFIVLTFLVSWGHFYSWLNCLNFHPAEKCDGTMSSQYISYFQNLVFGQNETLFTYKSKNLLLVSPNLDNVIQESLLV